MIIDSSSLDLVLQTLQQNTPVVFPTETVYGLGANAYADSAVQKIYAIKGRPAFNPLIVHYPNLESALKDAEIPSRFIPLLEHYWPGPLTVIARKKPCSQISSYVTAGLPTVAIRVPAHPIALQILHTLDFPLAAPSANTSGFLSPTTAQHVWEDLKEKVPYILDGGPCMVGIESTIIDITCDPLKILRPGQILGEQFAAISLNKLKDIICPGQLAHHYAPRKKIRLNATTAESHEGYIVFGNPPAHSANIVLQLSATQNLTEAAQKLFQHLHTLDQSAVQQIAIMSIPKEGIGIAINDRLQRAATPLSTEKIHDVTP